MSPRLDSNRRLIGAALLAVGLCSGLPEAAFGQADAIREGVSVLRTNGPNGNSGQAALAALAMIKADVPLDDPALQRTVSLVASQFDGTSYTPGLANGAAIYEAGVTAMLLANLDPDLFQDQIRAVANFLIGKQKSNGSWDYNNRSAGDTSISQYAVLGLWEAENAGIPVPPRIWESAARWYLSVQSSQGSWNYHRDSQTWPETVSMTAAGVGSLLICKRQLEPYRNRARAEEISPLLIPIVTGDERRDYRVSLSEREIDEAVQRGIAWIGRHFDTYNNKDVFGPSPYYGLYGIERVGSLVKQERLGGINWFSAGSSYIIGNQNNGGWNAQYDRLPNTSWAVLFLTRATQKTLQKIEVEKLGAGTLLGGRGLPEDLSALTVAEGRVVVRPMNGAIEEMLEVLEDPRAQGGESALAGLIDRYYKEGPAILRPHIDRFQRLLEEGDAEQRMLAAWALARVGELDFVPNLIAALEDPDDDVVATARIGLELISRKLAGFGPPRGADAELKAEAAQKWQAWYESIRPPELSDQIRAGVSES